MNTQLSIAELLYFNNCFKVTVEEFEKIHTGNIEIENVKTGNKELFIFESGNETEKKFKNNKGLSLIIKKHDKDKKHV